jgi:DNA-binding transcriptional LysR family regulator
VTVPPADLLLFAAVVREGSFTRAARQLGITKQTASERIGRLEERLGVRLLERTTRRLWVTDVGGRYYERCSAIAAQIEEANREAQQQQVEPTGLLRVTAPTLYGRRFLAPVVASYLAQNPRVRVEIVLADRRVSLVDEGFDLAIRIGELDDSSLSARKLGEGHVYHVASPAFLAAAASPALLAGAASPASVGAPGAPAAAALRAARCIGTRPVETWQIGAAQVKIEPALVVNDLEVACEAAIAGLGVARLPSLVCRDAVTGGRLRVLSGLGPAMRRPVYAVFPSRRHLPARVRVFLDALAALVAPMLPLDAAALAPAPRPRARLRPRRDRRRAR